SFEVCEPVSQVVRRAIPQLGYSRFPASDYKLFVYLGVLLPCIAGLCRSLEETGPLSPRIIGSLALGSCLLMTLGAYAMYRRVPEQDLHRFIPVFCWQAAALSGLLLVYLAHSRIRFLAIVVGLPLLCAVAGWPVAKDLKNFWQTEPCETLYLSNGVS